MFTFDKRDDGFMVFSADGRGVAAVSKNKKGDWEIHFTGYKFTVEEVEAFLKELAEKK